MCALISFFRNKSLLLLLAITTYSASSAQRDSTALQPVDTFVKNAPVVQEKRKVDSTMLAHSPRKAAIRSAILPGWGQAYNKKYWKIPIVYGALGVTAGIFVYNVTNYRDLRFAYQAKYKASLPPPARDSSDYFKIKPDLIPLDMQSLRFYRDDFRRNIDYSVIFFLVFWGLNVVDATVDAHLKSFDVTPDLSLQFRCGKSQMAGTTGVSIILAFKR